MRGRPKNVEKMRKSTFSIASHLYRRLMGLEVVREITGGVYKDARPANSDKEDIVIQAAEAILEPGGSAKARIVLYTSPVFSDRGDAVELIPDYKRLEYLCARVFDGLDEVFSGDCLTWVDAQTFSSQGDMFCAEMEVSVSLRGM